MYGFSGFIQNLAYLAIIVFIGYFFIQMYLAKRAENAPRVEHEERKRRFNHFSPVSPEEGTADYVEPSEAIRQNFSFAKVPSITAGQTLMNLPTVNPIDPKALTNDRTVLAVARAVAYPKQGRQVYDLIFTDANQLTGLVGGKPCVFNRLDLTNREITKVEWERQEAVDSGELQMKNLLGDGRDWEIKWAMGANNNIEPDEHSCSYIQVLSLHKALGEKDGFDSPLADALMDGAEHDYYDVMATNDKDDQILYAFYSGMNGWHVFIGRRLDQTEVDQIQVI